MANLRNGRLFGKNDEGPRRSLFLFGKSRESIEDGPYLEALKAEVWKFFSVPEAVDEYVMQTIREYKEKKIVSADSDEVKLEKLDQEDKGESLNKRKILNPCASG